MNVASKAGVGIVVLSLFMFVGTVPMLPNALPFSASIAMLFLGAILLLVGLRHVRGSLPLWSGIVLSFLAIPGSAGALLYLPDYRPIGSLAIVLAGGLVLLALGLRKGMEPHAMAPPPSQPPRAG